MEVCVGECFSRFIYVFWFLFRLFHKLSSCGFSVAVAISPLTASAASCNVQRVYMCEIVHKNDTKVYKDEFVPIKRTVQTNVHGTLAYRIIGLE